MADYLPRLVDSRLEELLAGLPAVMLVGPRAAGKTTTARRFAQTVVRLDREAEATAFRADADAALRDLDEPVLLDEWQAVPAVLGAVKRAVDEDGHPGRFLLTGSVRAELEGETWPGTGRVVRAKMTGLSMREIAGDVSAPLAIDRVAADGPESLTLPEEVPDLRGYLELATAGTFPEPTLSLAAGARRHWLDGYLDQLVMRDAAQLAPRRDPARLRRYFEALALSTAGVVRDKKLYDVAGITAKTAAGYDQLLVDLFTLDIVPAWATNRLKRLVRAGKRYLVDPALATTALALDVNGLIAEGEMIGRVLDTFVAAQLRAETSVSGLRPRLHHLRAEGGRREVDLIVELGGGRVIGVEVKASAAPNAESARHLRWLRDELGDRFCAGLVLHTGPMRFRLDERIFAVPICALWG